MGTLRLRDHYDWVVLGDHPGALLSASMVARLGLSVLVVPFIPARKRIAKITDQCLDFESNYLIGLRALVRSNGLLLECLRRSGMLASEEGHLIHKEDAFPQVITPNSRFRFPLADNELLLECERELGKAVATRIGLVEALKEAEPEFLRYWYHLPERLTLKEKTADENSGVPRAIDGLRKRLVRDSDLSQRLRRVWFSEGLKAAAFAKSAEVEDFANVARGLWYGASGAPGGDPQLMDVLHLLALGRSGASFRGGMTAYREFLLTLAKRSGAQIIEKQECKRIFLVNGQLAGVQISNYAKMVTVGGGVLGCSLENAAEHLTVSGKKMFRRLKAPLKPVGWRFTLTLSVHSEAVPAGTTQRMVWQEADAPPLEIEIADPIEQGLRETGRRLIFVRTVLPMDEKTLEHSYLRMVATRMFRQVTEIMPFVEYHVTRIFPDFRSVESGRLLRGKLESVNADDHFGEVYGFGALAKIPFNLLCFQGDGVGSQSGIDGLFVATDESFPDLGSLGPTIAAVEAVAWLAHRVGLAGPFVVPGSKNQNAAEGSGVLAE